MLWFMTTAVNIVVNAATVVALDYFVERSEQGDRSLERKQ